MSWTRVRLQFCGVAAALCAGMLAARPAQAVLVAYDGFDYATGDLAAQNGGSGFTNAWTRANGTGSVVTGGLTYTDSQGNQLAVSGNHAFFSGVSGNGDFSRDIAMQGATDGVTTWWSFISQRLSPHATNDENLARASSLQIRNTVTTTPSVERLAVGKGTTASPSVTSTWSMLHSGAVGNAVQTTKPILDQAFLVVRIDHAGDSTVADTGAWLWVNPRLDQVPNIANADASYTSTTTPAAIDFSFNRIRAFAGNTASGSVYAEMSIDEIRVGTTFADVAPIAGAPPTINANFNGVNGVEGGDFIIWQQNVGKTGAAATQPLGNANGDNAIDKTDLDLWKTRFGQASLAAVPEPTSLALAAAVGLVLMRRRRAGG
jgi:hypothetical protein